MTSLLPTDELICQESEPKNLYRGHPHCGRGKTNNILPPCRPSIFQTGVIDAGDYLTAWACLATQRRARQGLVYFTAEWQCVRGARVVDIRPMPEVEISRPTAVECQMFQVHVDLKMTRDCFDGLVPGPFTVLVRETPDGPWLIDSFNTGP